MYAESFSSLRFEMSGRSRLTQNRAGLTAGAVRLQSKQDIAIRIAGSSVLTRNVASGLGGAILTFAQTGSLVGVLQVVFATPLSQAD